MDEYYIKKENKKKNKKIELEKAENEENENNLMHGVGIYHFNNNSIYEGNWKNNKMNGFGILKSNYNNTIFIGFFEDDYKNGFGIMIWIN